MKLRKDAVTENEIKANLAVTYRLLAALKMDDLTYTHLSARIPNSQLFYIHPLGQLFSEVTAESLLSVDLEGKVIHGSEPQYNKTGYVIHSAIYRARPDINAIFHLHTTHGVAVSAMEGGLLPISQFSFHFYNRLAYHHYDSLALDAAKQGQQLALDLGTHKAMILHNHGTLTCGVTIHEAFFYAYYLEQACKVQCAAMASGRPLIYPAADVCERAAQDMRHFEQDLGYRDWQALKRKMENRENNVQMPRDIPRSMDVLKSNEF
jgi:ribulose-5-phosphate 4-epimerase/fuculose-1-phosphate aldolase